MIYFYHDPRRGWFASREDIRIAGPYPTYDDIVLHALRERWLGVVPYLRPDPQAVPA